MPEKIFKIQILYPILQMANINIICEYKLFSG